MRAVAAIGKSIDDDECIIFTLAIGQAMVALAGAAMNCNATEKLEQAGIPDFLAGAMAIDAVEAQVNSVNKEILRYLQEPGIVDVMIDKMNVHIGKRIERMKEEAKLPKGD